MVATLRQFTIALLVALGLVACGGDFTTKVDEDRPELVDQGPLRQPDPRTFVRITLPDQRDLLRPVRDVNLQNVALIHAIHEAMPGAKVIPLDGDVDMARPVSIFTANKMTTKEFLEQLTGITDYHFEYTHGSLRVASLATERWNLSTYAARRNVTASVGQSVAVQQDDSSSGDSAAENTQTRQVLTFDEDSFATLLDGAREMLGIEEDNQQLQQQLSNQDNQSLEQRVRSKAYVVGSRQMGIVEAAASPSRLQKLDSWLSELVKRSSSQINLDVRYYEVQLDDERGAGIDWTALFQGTDDGQPGSLELTSPTPGLFRGSGVFSIGGVVDTLDFDAEVFFRFLQRYGQVRLLTQPNVTVTNGTPAYISSAEEFSFTSSIEQSQDAQGQVTVTPQLSRVKVGVTMSVTPHRLEGDRIMIDVVPVVTSLQGFDEFETGESAFQIRTPNIALDELATQVITSSGKPVRLGGLISERVAETLRKIPREGDQAALYDFLFQSELNNLNRKELVISITPRLVGT